MRGNYPAVECRDPVEEVDTLSKSIKPELLSINVCDQVIREEGTGKTSLIGLFTNINSIRFPCHHPLLHIHIAVTGGNGKQIGKLRFINDETNTKVLELTGDVEFQDRTSTVEMNFRIANLRLETPGHYHFEFWLDDALIGQRSFTANRIPGR